MGEGHEGLEGIAGADELPAELFLRQVRESV